MLYSRTTWMLYPEDYEGLRAAHNHLLLEVVRFRRKARSGYKTLPYRDVPVMTNIEHDETIICKRKLWFPGGACRAGRNTSSETMDNKQHKGPRRLAAPPSTEGGRPLEPTCTRGSSTKRSATRIARLRCGGQDAHTIGALRRRGSAIGILEWKVGRKSPRTPRDTETSFRGPTPHVGGIRKESRRREGREREQNSNTERGFWDGNGQQEVLRCTRQEVSGESSVTTKTDVPLPSLIDLLTSSAARGPPVLSRLLLLDMNYCVDVGFHRPHSFLLPCSLSCSFFSLR